MDQPLSGLVAEARREWEEKVKQNIPLEKNIVALAIKKLNAIPGCRAKKHHGSAYGHMELDVYGCINGRFFALECKRPGGKLSERQVKEIEKWRAVGAISGVFFSAQEAVDMVMLST